MSCVLDLTTSVSIVACFSYIIFYALFVASQIWWAFALVGSSLYFLPLIFGLQRKDKIVLGISLLLHTIALLAIIGWTAFFFVAIFKKNGAHRQVFNWLNSAGYLGGKTNNGDDVATYASIAMTCDGAFTAIIMLMSAILGYIRFTKLFETKDNESEGPYAPRQAQYSYENTVAVPIEDMPSIERVERIPRLRTTSEGAVTAAYRAPTVITGYAEPRRYSDEPHYSAGYSQRQLTRL